MDGKILLPLLVTTVVAVAGWVAAHRFTMRRDRAAKRRELRTSYLIEAYRRLERVTYREEALPQVEDMLESAIADIQSFGSVRQVELAHQFVREFTENGSADISDLLSDLRRELREELDLEAVPQEVAILRLLRQNNPLRPSGRVEIPH